MKLNTFSVIFATKQNFSFSYHTATKLFLLVLLALAGAAWAGFYVASTHNTQRAVLPQWQNIIQSNTQKLICDASVDQPQFDIAIQYIGKIEANLIRINALGERLVESAALNPQEFNFHSDVVPMGGPLISSSQPSHELVTHLINIDQLLETRYEAFKKIQQYILTNKSAQELTLSGDGKAAAGWISSFYGSRIDPFSGQKAWHSGVDIVAAKGTPIKALAAGVVTYADTKGGYGNLVEIRHAGGLSTRYGHNDRLLVSPGQLVKKGQNIALLGSTGRSTGAHLHLEVHQDGQAVDPGLYFKDLRK